MNISSNPNWLSAGVQSHIDPHSIPIIKAEMEEEKSINIIKVKMLLNPASYTSKIYDLKIFTFENGQP